MEAGLQLAERQSLAQISINEIVAAAGKAKGTFYVHFSDRTEYLVALHRLFHDRLKVTVTAATANLTPGPERLWVGSLAYLDRCLSERGVKALLLEARSEPAIAAEVQRRNREFAAIAEADFAAIGWQPATQCAYLYVTMVAEAALLELPTGQADEAVRAGLRRFIFRD